MFVISVIFNVIFNTNNLSGLQKKQQFLPACVCWFWRIYFLLGVYSMQF